MSEIITLEDFYKLFQESERQRQESERVFNQLLQRSREEAAERSAEYDRRTAEIRVENERTIQELRKSVASLTSRWGQFVENFIEPAVVHLLQSRGIAVQETHRRMVSSRPNVAMEIDILAVDGDVAVAIEVKSRLSLTAVDEFLEKLAHFKEAFPRYSDVRLNGAVAGIEVDKGVDRYAYRQGLFVIRQSGETVEIANDLSFKPQTW